ncbi:hypothetical protein BJ741DRAFT_649372 [Chytriomyces cf. hyalinus JEL632]|nr:hypothetical protein BJ741DRAFT_649372 [Chytriomyces cf. hyalinus JEL632]
MNYTLESTSYRGSSNANSPSMEDFLAAVKNLSHALECPLTHTHLPLILTDPVIISDGRTYCRHHIAAFFSSHVHPTSPVTHEFLPSDLQLANYAIRDVLDAYKQLECVAAESDSNGSLPPLPFFNKRSISFLKSAQDALNAELQDRLQAMEAQYRDSQDALNNLEQAHSAEKSALTQLEAELAAKNETLHQQAIILEKVVSNAERDARGYKAQERALKTENEQLEAASGRDFDQKTGQLEAMEKQMAFWDRVQTSPVESFAVFLASLWNWFMGVLWKTSQQKKAL